ncbi:MAG: YhbY family RNA-binding protein [Promethearchaeota archaeon]
MPTKADLARIWAEEKPAVRIGKGGLDAGVIEEVNRQLKKRKVIKVRFLKSTSSSSTLSNLITQLASQTSSEVWGRRGFVVILARKSK